MWIRENSVQPVAEGEEPSTEIKQIAAAFQSTVIRSLMNNVRKLAEEYRPRTLMVAGGVACNLALREAAESFGTEIGIPVYFPSRHLSTDNAAMIAAAGYFRLSRGEVSPRTMTADVTIRLQNIGVEDAELKRKRVRVQTLKTSDVRRQTSDVRRQTSDVRRQMSDGRRQISEGRYQTADVRRQTAVMAPIPEFPRSKIQDPRSKIQDPRSPHA